MTAEPEHHGTIASINTPSLRKRRRPALPQNNVELCQFLYETIRNAKNEEGKLICEAFIRLPNRRNAADYYAIVKQPIDLLRIQHKTKSEEYESAEAMALDVQLLVANAHSFYKPESIEHSDASELLRVFQCERAVLEASIPMLSAASGGSGSATSSGSSSLSGAMGVRPAKRPLVASAADFSPTLQMLMMQLFAEVVRTRFCDDDGGAAQSNDLQQDEGRLISEAFLLLPSKTSYPDYYEVIREPLDLRMIAARLSDARYQNLEELDRDLQLMLKNARTYNEPKSQLYMDATTLSRLVRSRKLELVDIVRRMSAVAPQPLQRPDWWRDNVELVVAEVRDLPLAESPSTPENGVSVDSEEALEEDEEDDPSNYSVSDPRHVQLLLYQFIASYRNSQGHNLADPFLRLPNKKLYPDYYQEILQPMSLLTLKRKLRRGFFASLDELASQFELVFANAQQYNIEESKIFRDSMKLQKAMRAKKEELQMQLQLGSYNSTTTPSNAASTAQLLMQQQQQHMFLAAESAVSDDLLRPLYPQSLPPMPPLFKIEVGDPDHMSVQTALSAPQSALAAGGLGCSATPEDKRKPGRKPLSPEEMRKKRIRNIYNSISNAVGENGRFLRTIFMVLPSKDVYPDYYQVIPEPIDLTTIKDKLDRDLYETHAGVVSDLRLMFANAKHYNEEGSQVYKDAETLERILKKKLKNLGPLGGAPRQKKSPNTMLSSATSSALMLQQRLQELYQTVKDYRDASGRLLSTPFLRLPTRAEMPAYYEFIKRPIEMQTLHQRVAQCRFQSMEELVADFTLLFDNACRFNEPDSQIYQDAVTLMRVVMEKRAMLLGSSETEGVEEIVTDVRSMAQETMKTLFSMLLAQSDTNGRPLVDSLEEALAQSPSDGVGVSVDIPRSLEAIRRALQVGRYRRVDRLQEDVLAVLRHVRQFGAEQARIDAAQLQAAWIQLRDSVLRRGELLLTPALSYTEQQLAEELQAEQRAIPEMAVALKLPDSVPQGAITEMQLSNTQCLRQGAFVVLEPAAEDAAGRPEVGRLLWIQPASEAEPCQLRVQCMCRPEETRHTATRRFLLNEILATFKECSVPITRLRGFAAVRHPTQHSRSMPLNGTADSDVLLCENIYEPERGNFRLLSHLDGLDEENVIDREAPLTLMRLARPDDPHLVPAINVPSGPQAFSLLDKAKDCVMQEDRSGTEGVIYYDQFVYPNGFWVKVGDYVYVPSVDGQNRNMVRVDRLWKNCQQDVLYFSGAWFLTPHEVDHLPTRRFLQKEVLMSSQDHATHLLSSVVGKCVVQSSSDYCAYRPTEYAEDDIYQCESKYVVAEKFIRKLKKGLKKFKVSPNVCEDEFYFLRKHLLPRKEPSPLLCNPNQPPLNIDSIINVASFEGEGELTDSLTLNSLHGGAPTSYTESINVAACASLMSSLEDSINAVAAGAGTLEIPDMSMTDSYSMGGLTPADGKKRKVKKAPSGYVVFAGEVRKRIMQGRSDADFGQISKEVGSMWRNLPQEEKDKYECRAQDIRKQMAVKAAERRQEEEEKAAANAAGALTAAVVTSSNALPQQQQLQQQQQQQQASFQLMNSQQVVSGAMLATYPTNNTAAQPLLYQVGQQQLLMQNTQGVRPLTAQMATCVPPASSPAVLHVRTLSSQNATQPVSSAQTTPSPGTAQQQIHFGSTQSGPAQADQQSAQQQQQHYQQAVVQVRPPSPVFVTVPPKTSRVQHGEAYRAYIQRISGASAQDDPTLDLVSDWPRSLLVSERMAPSLSSQALRSAAERFLPESVRIKASKLAVRSSSQAGGPSDGGAGALVAEALWSLRDHLMEDALRLRRNMPLPLEQL